MRILHVSDIHCSYSSIQRLPRLVEEHGADLVVVTGDFECDEAVHGLEELPVPVLAVAGNMDDTYIMRLLKEKGISIEGEAREHGGYRFVGISGRSVKSFIGKAEELLKAGDPAKTILVSHHPPHKTRVDVALRFLHAGLKEIRALIEKYGPRIHLCGHIHESRGVDTLGSTLVVNPGPFSKGYYAVVMVEEKRAELGKVKLY